MNTFSKTNWKHLSKFKGSYISECIFNRYLTWDQIENSFENWISFITNMILFFQINTRDYQAEKYYKVFNYQSILFFYNNIKKDMLYENATCDKAISFSKCQKLDILVRSCWFMEVSLVSFSKIMHRHFYLGEQ